jgi:hypothetical protein
MNKRLLSAATAVALCVLVSPASARSFDDDDGWHPRRAYGEHHGRRWERVYERDDEDGEAYGERRHRHRAARHHRSRKHDAAKSPGHRAAKAITPAAAPAQAKAAPPKLQLLAAASPQGLDLPQLQPLLPPEAAKPAPRAHARNDGRSCLKPAARALLERIEAQFGPMQIISTCRPGARIAGSGRISKHATGEAIDFSAGRRKAEVVRWLIANHKSGGTMTYSDMSHIHVDVGQHFVALNAYSGR